MRRTAFLLLAFTLLLPGTSPAADGDSQSGSSGRVLIAPLNLGVRAAPEVQEGIEPVWQELVRHFEDGDARPASLARDGAAALWNEAVGADGQPEKRDVYAAYARFARSLAEQVEYEELVIPSLVPRKATVRGNHASWDGVRHFVPTPMDSYNSGEMTITTRGANGELRAASLHVAVLSPDGELRFEGAGGLTLLQRVQVRMDDRSNQFAVADRQKPFDDADALRRGIEAAFAKPLPASRAR